MNSVLGSNITIEEGAVVKDCVIMSNVVIEKDAVIEYAIVDHDARICAGAKVGGSKETSDLTVVAANETIEAADHPSAAKEV